MSQPRITIGSEFFRKIREEHALYMDKTGLIEELLWNKAEVSLITRPRRFGKTLTMTMLRDFFDIRQDSRAIFEGLAIARNKELCESWMNQYPTVFLTLKGAEGLTLDEALYACAEIIGALCAQHSYLYASPHVEQRDKEMLHELESTEDKNLLAKSINTLCRALHAHYGKPVILLIDEYDVPLAKAQENGYYREMVTFLRGFLGGALKTNPSLAFAVLTGCLRISRESIFTGLNNFRCYGIDHTFFADKIGFTSADVDALLEIYGLADKKPVVQEWYDGYRFGNNVEMYCPWDVLQYVVDAQSNPAATPRAYWNNSSGNAIIRSFVGRTDLHVAGKFETLLAGGCVEADIVEGLTYDALYDDEDSLWTLLYYTGYLTRAQPEQMEQCGILPGGDSTPLVIPNREVREIFTRSVASWFRDTVRKSDRTELFRMFWSGDAAELTRLLRRQLYMTISYHDAREDFYHAFLAGMLSFSAYEVQSNRESGNGRPDILVFDRPGKKAAILEIKHARSYDDMEQQAQKALRQIEERQYASGLPRRLNTVLRYGVAFCQKECLVLRG
ncbi:MAG: AAA family ATPase [Desulfovibrionaceae bacterium]|nr:AAA family ATPase [Desulfovibrionaceae bacterium]